MSSPFPLHRKFSLVVFVLLLGFIFFPTAAHAATYTVTKTADTNDGTCDGDCSLREAIAAANNNAGHDTIEFDIPTSDGGYVPASGSIHAYWSLQINGGLSLSDSDGVFIDGYTQSGASRNTAPFGQINNAILTIQLIQSTNANLISTTPGGVLHLAGLNVQLLTNPSGGNSILLNGSSGSHNNWIEGNYFGTDITGTETSGVWGSILLYNGSNSNVIGTNGDGIGDEGERNVIVINATTNNGAVYVNGDNNVIAGNYLGVNKTGRVCGTGNIRRQQINIAFGSNNRIGTNLDNISDNEEGNILACVNTDIRAQIRINAPESVIQGNYIGTNPQLDNLSNGIATPGVSSTIDPSNNMIKRNLIAYNGSVGIGLYGAATTRNTIRENRIFNNGIIDGKLDLDLGNEGPTQNDAGDIDSGPNDLQNYPTIEWAEYIGNGRYEIYGHLDGNPSEGPWTIEVCKASEHPSDHGGCLQPLGTVTTDKSHWLMTVTVDGDSNDRLSWFTALATNANGSTSEFGPNVHGRVRGLPTASTPRGIDLAPFQGGVIDRSDIVSIVPSGTFKWDAYLSIQRASRLGAFRIPGTQYWQASDIFEYWWKAYYNDARILADEVQKPFIVSISYNPLTLEPNLPEKNLKLAYSGDEGKTWRVLPNSVLDQQNKSVATVTKNGGWYMLVSGYPFAQSISRDASPSPVAKASTQPQPSATATPKPTPTPSARPETTKVEETPSSPSCTRFLFWCI